MPVDTSAAKALLDVPLGEILKSLGLAIATAQQELDQASLKMAQLFTGEYVDKDGNKEPWLVPFDGEELSLMELGFSPTFYQFVETTIEIKVSMSTSQTDEKTTLSGEVEGELGFETGLGSGLGGLLSGDVSALGDMLSPGSAKLGISMVGASYSSKYQYSAEASSSIRTRLVPVPPPALLEERMRRSFDKKYKARQED